MAASRLPSDPLAHFSCIQVVPAEPDYRSPQQEADVSPSDDTLMTGDAVVAPASGTIVPRLGTMDELMADAWGEPLPLDDPYLSSTEESPMPYEFTFTCPPAAIPRTASILAVISNLPSDRESGCSSVDSPPHHEIVTYGYTSSGRRSRYLDPEEMAYEAESDAGEAEPESDLDEYTPERSYGRSPRRKGLPIPKPKNALDVPHRAARNAPKAEAPPKTNVEKKTARKAAPKRKTVRVCPILSNPFISHLYQIPGYSTAGNLIPSDRSTILS